MKKIAIAGGRDYTNREEAYRFIEQCIREEIPDEVPVILSGGCRGADALGEQYAGEHGWQVEKFLPRWDEYGRAAGPIRNAQIAEKCDFAICFWDGKSRGTRSLMNLVKKNGKKAYVFRYSLQKDE